MDKILKNLLRAQFKYESVIGNSEQQLSGLIDFEFSILWQSADGFVISDDMGNSPLDECLKIIKEKGRLTYEDYVKIGI